MRAVILLLVMFIFLTSCSNHYAEYVQPVSPENNPPPEIPASETSVTVPVTETPQNNSQEEIFPGVTVEVKDAPPEPKKAVIKHSSRSSSSSDDTTPPAAENPVTTTPSPETPSEYPVHQNIYTTYFYIGETATEDNGYIPNDMSAWDEQWQQHYGGVDDPSCRDGYNPCFTPKENPFYCALPYSDFDRMGRKSNINKVYWYNSGELDDKISLVKNRWIKITFNGKTAYCQWEDAGPFNSDDVNYVFGTARPLNEQENPENQAGLDVSPAVKDYLGLNGYDQTNWQFVDNAPDGPWKEVVTSSGTNWS